MIVAMQKGVARGIFSNESGLGSAPIAAAAARTKDPVRQGLVSMTGTFIDTIVICTMTGLSIVIAGSWLDPKLEGVADYNGCIPEGTAVSRDSVAYFFTDVMSGILCIYNDPRMGLLWRAVCGISVQPQ